MDRAIEIEERPKQLFRYSETKWLEKSLLLGEFRINSASYIKSFENDNARQDDEMCFKHSVSKDQAIVANITKGQKISPKSDVVFINELTTDYYMLCLSSKKASYLFDTFKDSNSCLIIHDTHEFCNRIYCETDRVLHNWSGVDAKVVYGGMRSALGPAFMKPIDYIFQHEWRFAWIPPRKMNDLDYFTLKIGSIEDISEIVDKF